MGLGDTAAAVGRGLVAGVAGTAAMTVSSTLEAKLRGRGTSSAPADAAGKILGGAAARRAVEGALLQRSASELGTGWGIVRGLLHASAIDGIAAPAVLFTAVWGGAQVMLPALDVAPAPWNSPKQEVAIGAFHHAV